jgi:DNA-binding transcriptional LysR family regulator
VPHLFGQLRIARIAADFRRRHPDVTLEIVLGDSRVDLIEDGFDAAIRVGSLPDSTLQARVFAHAGNIVAASPEMFGAATPASPGELAIHPVLALQRMGDGKAHLALFDRTGAAQTVSVAPVITVNSLTVLRDLAIAGSGIAVLPEFTIADDIASGRLIRLLPDWSGMKVPLSVVHPSGRFVTARLRHFIELLVDAFPDRAL